MPALIVSVFWAKALKMVKFFIAFGKQVRQEHSAFGNVGQWLGVLLMVFGFTYLIRIKADKLALLMNAGCIIFTLATKLKHERKV